MNKSVVLSPSEHPPFAPILRSMTACGRRISASEGLRKGSRSDFRCLGSNVKFWASNSARPTTAQGREREFAGGNSGHSGDR